MKKCYFLIFLFGSILIGSCTKGKTVRSLFDGENINQWETRGNVKLENRIFTLEDDASAILKKVILKISNCNFLRERWEKAKDLLLSIPIKTGKVVIR